MPSSANFGKLKPETMKPAKNFGGVICAVEVMCASTCSTVHASHSEAVAHFSVGSWARSSARAPRSAAMVVHMSAMRAR